MLLAATLAAAVAAPDSVVVVAAAEGVTAAAAAMVVAAVSGTGETAKAVFVEGATLAEVGVTKDTACRSAGDSEAVKATAAFRRN